VRKVVTVSLNGNALQLEDDGYAVLSTYLEQSTQALASNPDRAEIMSDLEQAIADKCAAYLNPHKTVVTRSEIEQVIAAMGPVDSDIPASASAPGANTGNAASAQGPNGPAPRRLYQISEGAIISGICNGYAAYSGIDVTWIRVIFVLLVLVTWGGALLAYLILMFVIPYANTTEEHAAARGLPFNARVLVESTKRHYTQFSREHWDTKDAWRSEWRRTRANWRTERRRWREQWRQYRRYGHGFAPPPPPPPFGAAATPPRATYYAGHVVTGSVLALLGLVLAVMSIAMVLAFVSLVNTGTMFGWHLPAGVPLWVGVIGMIILYNIVAWPIRAVRHSVYWYSGGYHGPWFAAWDGIVWLAIIAGLVWYGSHHVPEIRDFFQHLPRLWQDDGWSSGLKALFRSTA
jgi:phage shock protein PspC (stress-responsive transcriptional regulator)